MQVVALAVVDQGDRVKRGERTGAPTLFGPIPVGL
jgi:hypothetical protein